MQFVKTLKHVGIIGPIELEPFVIYYKKRQFGFSGMINIKGSMPKYTDIHNTMIFNYSFS